MHAHITACEIVPTLAVFLFQGSTLAERRSCFKPTLHPHVATSQHEPRPCIQRIDAHRASQPHCRLFMRVQRKVIPTQRTRCACGCLVGHIPSMQIMGLGLLRLQVAKKAPQLSLTRLGETCRGNPTCRSRNSLRLQLNICLCFASFKKITHNISSFLTLPQ